MLLYQHTYIHIQTRHVSFSLKKKIVWTKCCRRTGAYFELRCDLKKEIVFMCRMLNIFVEYFLLLPFRIFQQMQRYWRDFKGGRRFLQAWNEHRWLLNSFGISVLDISFLYFPWIMRHDTLQITQQNTLNISSVAQLSPTQHQIKPNLSLSLNCITYVNSFIIFCHWLLERTKRYGPLRGPISSSCFDQLLAPALTKVFFCPFGQKKTLLIFFFFLIL